MDCLNCDVYDAQLIRLCEELEEDQELFEIGELISQLHRDASNQIGRGAKRSAANFETEVPVKRSRPSTSRDHASTSWDRPSTSRDEASTSAMSPPDANNKLEDEQTRRMIIKNTGPVNVYIPRMYRPKNYTPIEERNLTEAEKLEYTPLVHYCFHKCPKKCPDIYKPVCLGRAGDATKYSPFIFVKNHCYMDYFKCMTNSYRGRNTTSTFEDIGFLFCGGYKMMNMLYMFPLVRILQRMGRLKKKGKAHFVMRNLGYFPQRLQG